MQGKRYPAQLSSQHISFRQVNHFFLLLLGAVTLQQIVSLRRPLITLKSRSDLAPRLTVWKGPSRCSGNFASAPAEDSATGFPYALLREASVDRRPIVKELFGYQDRVDTVRVLLFFSVHISANLTEHDTFVTLDDADETECPIDHLSHVYKGGVRWGPLTYHPGKTVFRGKEMTAWQIGIALPSIEAISLRQLRIHLGIRRYDGQLFRARLNFPVHCVMGWNLYGIDNVNEDCIKSPEHVDGAAAFLGSPLFGGKRRSPKAHRQVAHMAARALLGPVAFDVLFVTAPNEYSLTEYDTKCGKDWRCRLDLDNRNVAFFSGLARTIESELDVLGVPHDMFPKVHLIPTCRFGTHIGGEEKGDPCIMSLSGGQFMNMFYTHSMVAPYFRWAMSVDLDEFLGEVPGFKTNGLPTTGRAADLLNRFDLATHPPRAGFMHLPWINFKVSSDEKSLAVTRGLFNHTMPELVRNDDESSSESCTELHKYGKAAVRCDVAVGFDIHFPLAVVRNDSSLNYRAKKRKVNGLATWHARFQSSQGPCKVAV